MAARRTWFLCIALITIACASSQHSATSDEYVIPPDSLRRLLDDFAADSMLGRSYLNAGHDRATAYLAREAARAGLEPAGDRGGWFQMLHFYSRRLSAQSRIMVGDSALAPVRDFRTISFGTGPIRSMAGVQVVYGGVIGDTTTQISAEAAASRVVILNVPADMTPGRIFGNIGYGPPSRFANAAAVAIVCLELMSPSQRAIFSSVGPLDSTTPRADAQPTTLLVSRRAASIMLGRSVDGTEPGTMGRVLGDRMAFEERDIPTRNVIGVLRGSDATLSRAYVALGAHSDHLGMSPAPLDHDSVRAAALMQMRNQIASESLAHSLRDSLASRHSPRLDSIFNGADDNGSGSVALLEVARALSHGVRPRRSVLFVWHAGEEDGNVGSNWFVEHPTIPLDSIVAEINLDMVGRGGANDITGGGPRFLQVLGSTRRSAELLSLIARANADIGLPFVIDTADTEGAYCRSDHWNYARFGIPIAFFTTGSHIDYHSVTDEVEYIDFTKLTAVSRLTVAVVRALANRTARLRLDRPAPNPRSRCQS
jgi:hypothetical protein